MDPKRQLIKVMIVDDEILAIEHLKSLLNWEDYGFTVMSEALTAIQAIEIAKEVNPQVIFMDIRMPHIDGLETSKRILSFNRHVKIVLFTSHRDFEYAKEAIQIGISNYLIKHEMNAVHLKEELIKIKNELVIQEQKELLLIRQSLRELLEGKKTDTNVLQELEHQIDGNKSSFILLFILDDIPFPVIEINLDMYYNGMFDGELWRNQPISESLNYVGTVAFEKGKQAMLFSVKQTYGENQMWSVIHSVALKVQMEAKRKGSSVTVIISPLFIKLEKLPQMYRLMEKKAASMRLSGTGNIRNMQDILIPDSEDNVKWQAELKWIRNKHKIVDEDNIMKRITMTFELLTKGQFQPDLLKSICRDLVHELEQLREKKGMPSYVELSFQNKLDINKWYTAEGIKKWFISEFKYVMSYYNPVASYSKKVQQVIRYIEEHYQEDMTIDSIGVALFMSGDHLRHLFKEETGRTVIDFLTGYRMEKAKQLLAAHDYKVYEISNMVGYKTSQYFCQVFKKWFGVTPQEYIESVVNDR